MISCTQKDAFWNVVQDCLVEFHGQTKPAAEVAVRGLREKIEAPPIGMSTDIFYHSEPFEIACRIAHRELDLKKGLAGRYEAILERHNW